ncbi:MAG: hypothetical protein QXQ46_11425 [Thermoplasmatales archaeon]
MMPRAAFDGSDAILLHYELAYPYDLSFREMFVIQRCKNGPNKRVVTVKTSIQLVSGTIPSPPYYVLALLSAKIPATVILACNRFSPLGLAMIVDW